MNDLTSNAHTRVTTPFTSTSTADEVIAGIDLSGKRAVVTGGAAGIGLETSRALATAGAEVTLAVRDLEQARNAIEDIGSPLVRASRLDLADQTSIAAFVAGWTGPLDILVANAGVMATPERRTTEGWEMQFATNHLGHFALALGLLDALRASGHARIVVVSSVGHLNGPMLFDDPNFERHPYDPWAAYSQSKTANVLFAVEAARRWAADGITVNALTPGRIMSTGLMRHLDEQPAPPARFEAGNAAILSKTIEQGAATSVLLAASPLVEGVTGRYFADSQEAEPQQPGIRSGVADYAVDPANAERLWQLSLDLLASARRAPAVVVGAETVRGSQGRNAR